MHMLFQSASRDLPFSVHLPALPRYTHRTLFLLIFSTTIREWMCMGLICGNVPVVGKIPAVFRFVLPPRKMCCFLLSFGFRQVLVRIIRQMEMSILLPTERLVSGYLKAAGNLVKRSLHMFQNSLLCCLHMPEFLLHSISLKIHPTTLLHFLIGLQYPDIGPVYTRRFPYPSPLLFRPVL